VCVCVCVCVCVLQINFDLKDLLNITIQNL
jgi:hypothetical protein